MTHVAGASSEERRFKLFGTCTFKPLNRRVRFLSTVELVNALEQAKLNDNQGRLANRFCHADLIILDELGYLPFS